MPFICLTNRPPCEPEDPWKLNVTLGTGRRWYTGVRGQAVARTVFWPSPEEDEHQGRLCLFKHAWREHPPTPISNGCTLAANCCSMAVRTIKSFSACGGMCCICLCRNAPGRPPSETCRWQIRTHISWADDKQIKSVWEANKHRYSMHNKCGTNTYVDVRDINEDPNKAWGFYFVKHCVFVSEASQH